MKQEPDRLWAVEGANGAGRPLAQRLVAAGERVVDVPARLAARVRLFDTGHNRKATPWTPTPSRSSRSAPEGLRALVEDGELEALRMLTDRRDEFAHQRVQTVSRLQRLLSELLPGQRKRDLSAAQAAVSVAAILAPSPLASAAVPAGDGSTNVVAPGDGACGGGVSAFYNVYRRSNPQPGIYYAEYTVKILNCTKGTVRRAIDVNNLRDSDCYSIPAGYVKTFYGAETDPGNLGEYRGIYAC